MAQLPDRPITVVLVDDHPVVRGGLRALIESFGGFEVVGEAADGEAAVREVQLHRPDVAVMDFWPAYEAPRTMPIAAISSSACTTAPPALGSSSANNSMMSVAGVIG